MAKPQPPGPDLAPFIARMREMAAASGDALVPAGPVHPDAQLLELCGKALHHLCAAKDLLAERHAAADAARGKYGSTQATLAVQLFGLQQDREAAAVQLMRAARKLRATTPAGIYAKALLVRASRTGAVELARTLAEELVDCRELRASLWPAEAGG